MVHLLLLINTLLGDQAVGEECLVVAALQTPKEVSSPSQASETARGVDLQLNLSSHKRRNKYYSNIL